MSASSAPFTRVRKSGNGPVIKAPTSFTRVTEPDESVTPTPTGEEVHVARLESPPYDPSTALSRRWSLYFSSWLLLSLLAGVVAGRFLYLLWEHVAFHDQQLAWHQTAIQGLTKTQTAVSNQADHLKSVDASVDAIQASFNAQAKRLADLEKAQAGIRDELSGMNTRWQKQMNELRREKVSAMAAPVARTESSPMPSPMKSLPAPPAQPASDKHNETFSQDLKPTPSSYAQMLPSGLVVWMTPRPGFPKPIPTSVIGQVHGLGMLVHDWDDNKHYFITESGNWLVDPR